MRTVLVCLLAAFYCFSSEAGKIKVKPGARAGVNSTFSGGNPPGYSVQSQVGFNAGVYATITGIWKKLYIQPQVDYYFNSYKFTRGLDNRDDRINTHTIQIPVTAGYTLVEKSKFFWSVNTGPMASILAGVSDNDFGINRDYYKPVVWSWRTETYLRVGKLSLNAGFDAGMSKMYEGANVRAHTWYGGISFHL